MTPNFYDPGTKQIGNGQSGDFANLLQLQNCLFSEDDIGFGETANWPFLVCISPWYDR